MPYVGKKATNAVDVAESQSLTVNGDLTVQTSSATPKLRIHADTDSSPVPAIELMRGADDTFGADIYGDFRVKADTGVLLFERGVSGTTTEHMRIHSDGHIGLGGTPVKELDIHADAPTLRLTDTDTTLSDGEVSSQIEFFQSDSSGGADIGASIET